MAFFHDRVGRLGKWRAGWAELAYELGCHGRGVTSLRRRGDEKGRVSMTGQWGDRRDQFDSAGLGELLCGGPFESLFLVYPKLGGAERSNGADQFLSGGRKMICSLFSFF